MTYGINTRDIEARLPHLSECCCGCSLRTGSIIVGYLSAAFGLFSLILTFSNLVTAWGYDTEEDAEAVYSKLIILLLVTVMIMDVINVILSAYMIAGATASKSKYLMPWIIYRTLEASIYVIGIIISACIAFSFGNVSNGFYVIIAGFLVSVLQAYCILVVLSLYRSLTSENDKEPTVQFNFGHRPPFYGSQISKTELI